MKNKVLIQVFVAIILAVIAGWLTGPDTAIFGVTYLKLYNLIGQLFLNALTLVVVPLVCSSIITGAARMSAEHSFGTLGKKTFGYYFLSLFIAACIGLATVLLISPGTIQGMSIPTVDGVTMGAIETKVDTFQKIEQVFLKIVPSNILAVAAQGQMLGLIFFSLLFGYFISKIEENASAVLLNFWKGIFQVMMRITHLVMRVLPIGVFGLVAKVVATTGLEAFGSVAYFFASILIGFGIYMFVAMPLVLKYIGRVSPLAHFKAIAPALFTAFTTTSSVATLPVTIDCIEKRARVSNRVCSFAIPLGTTMNMAGTVLFLTISSIFIAQVYGVELGFSTLMLVFIMSILSSCGVAGIPSGCLIGLVAILPTIGIPAEGIGLVMAVERIVDMFRTTINVFGNACCAVLIARSENEENVLAPLTLVENE